MLCRELVTCNRSGAVMGGYVAMRGDVWLIRFRWRALR